MTHETVLIVRCVYCKETREVRDGEVLPGDVPMCQCGGVMVADHAEHREIKAGE